MSVKKINKQYNVGVVGATGAVGQEMVSLLEKRKFPVKNLRLFASERSAGKKVKFAGVEVAVEELAKYKPSAADLDVALFSAGAAISKEYAPKFADAGIYVIDNSSAWRMDPGVPLVVPEINSHELSSDRKLIANPNCSTIQMVVVLNPLHKAAKIKRIVVATYQAVSGAGAWAIEDLKMQTKAYVENKPIPKGKKMAHQIAFNLIPQIDVFMDNGYTKEEMKMVNETQKIMGDNDIKVSATCIRVPVFRSHSEAVWIETQKRLTITMVRDILSNSEGVVLLDDPAAGKYPMPLDAECKDVTYVGRIREDISVPNGLAMWIVSDNLWKGAALNAVQIAEQLMKLQLL
ncbi:MAG: aspartate-semialdehyde dehydrogenase [Elusimicrobiota bacterium]